MDGAYAIRRILSLRRQEGFLGCFFPRSLRWRLSRACSLIQLAVRSGLICPERTGNNH